MAWYNNIGDLAGDIKSIVTGHNPSNNAPPSAIPAGGPGSVPGMQPIPLGGSNFPSTQPVYPGVQLPTGSSGAGDTGGDSFWSKIPGWVIDGLKIGLPAALNWIKDNAGTLAGAGSIAEAVYRDLQSSKYANEAMNDVKSTFAQKEPLRLAGIQGMMNPGAYTPDLSALRSLAGASSGNPFAKALPMAGPSAVGNHGMPPQPIPFAAPAGAPALPATPGTGNLADTRVGRIAQRAGLIR